MQKLTAMPKASAVNISRAVLTFTAACRTAPPAIAVQMRAMRLSNCCIGTTDKKDQVAVKVGWVVSAAGIRTKICGKRR